MALYTNDRWPVAVLNSGTSNLFLCLVWTSALAMNSLLRYAGANPCKDVNAIKTSLTSSYRATGNQSSCFNMGWCSQIFLPGGNPRRQFLHFLNSSKAFLCCTGPNWRTVKHLLKTRELMVAISGGDLSNRCFTRFIWHKLAVHLDTRSVTCSLKLRCSSTTTPKSLADCDGLISLPSKVIGKIPRHSC